MKKLAIITTHPIQYNAPWFKLLAQRKIIEIRVFYTWSQVENGTKYDPGFGTHVKWDIPLLEGYDYSFVKNVASRPGSHHFQGINNPTLIKEIETYDPAAILIFGWCFNSHLKVLRFFKGKKKILFRGDSTLLNEPAGVNVKKLLRRVFLKWVYRCVDAALYVGTANQQYYLAHGLTKEQLVFAPHAIDNDRFKKGIENERDTLGIPKDAIVFIFTGKFETIKDPDLLLEAFISLKNENAHLLLVGNGELENGLRAKAGQQAVAISNRIHFMSFQNQVRMPAIYRTGDIFVLPSRSETWGLSVNEAMACSKAVLVSDRCGCKNDLVKEGVNGFVFNSRDSNDLARKLNDFLKKPGQIDSMGARSFELIQSWRFEKICMAIEESVREVTNP